MQLHRLPTAQPYQAAWLHGPAQWCGASPWDSWETLDTAKAADRWLKAAGTAAPNTPPMYCWDLVSDPRSDLLWDRLNLFPGISISNALRKICLFLPC